MHRCGHGTPRLNVSAWRWCGSNFDALGNPRFRGSAGQIVPYFGEPMTAKEVGSKHLVGQLKLY